MVIEIFLITIYTICPIFIDSNIGVIKKNNTPYDDVTHEALALIFFKSPLLSEMPSIHDPKVISPTSYIV